VDAPDGIESCQGGCVEITKLGDVHGVDSPVDLFLADGAYDGEPTSDLLVARFGLKIEVTIPLPKNAVLSPNAAQDPTLCDRHIANISVRGRVGW
jgi:hypothetical protein